MKAHILLLQSSILLIATGAFWNVHAATPDFGAKASGSELSTPGIVVDGGPGISSASISESNFNADARFVTGATYLPELRAFSTNSTASNSDDITQSRAEAYEVFTSSVAQTIELNVSLHGVVVDGSTDLSSVLADVFVFGGPSFMAIDSPICPDQRLGQSTFDSVYFCGTRLGRSNLFIPIGDVTLLDQLAFNVEAGENFGVYARLRVNSSGGSADATQTLSLSFVNDEFLSPVSVPDSGVGEVAIDVKPGSDPNCFNLNGHGVVPVAILGSDTLDVMEIDPESLSFGGLAVRVRANRGPMCSADYSDADEHLDLVCQFEDDPTLWSVGSDEATVSGSLFDGSAIQGTDSICVVP